MARDSSWSSSEAEVRWLPPLAQRRVVARVRVASSSAASQREGVPAWIIMTHILVDGRCMRQAVGVLVAARLVVPGRLQ